MLKKYFFIVLLNPVLFISIVSEKISIFLNEKTFIVG